MGSNASSNGGRETLRRYGVQHFRELGRKGFAALVSRYWQGDRQAAADWLRLQAHEKLIARGVEAKLDRQLAQGTEIACEEIPCCLHPDDDMTFPESWASRAQASKEDREIPF